MIAPRPDRARRRGMHRIALVVAAVGALCLAVLAPPPDAARAAEPGDVAVTLASAIVEGTGPDAAVVVTGEVTNASDAPLHAVEVRLWRSTARLRSSEALESAIAADGPPTGSSDPVDAENQALLPGDAEPLAPGATRPFTVSGRLSTFGMTAVDTSYWVGAVVLASAAPDAEAVEAGSDRTLVTVPASGASSAVVGVVELSAAPRLIRPGLFTDDGLAEELTGRLALLLDAAARPEASWVVDPALLAEVRDMADGYEVVDGEVTRPGTGEQAAAAWLDRVEALPADRGHATLFAQPDLDAATAVDPDRLLARAVEVSADADAPDLPDASRLITLAAPGADTLRLVSPLGRPVLATGLSPGAAWVTAEDADVIAATRPADSLDSPVLADTTLNRAAVLAARARAAGSQVRLLRTEQDVAIDEAARPSWVQRVPLAALLATDPTPYEASADGPAREPAPDLAARVSDLPRALAAYASAAPGSGVGDLGAAQALRGASLLWLQDREGQKAWLSAVEHAVGFPALAAGITLGASPRFSMAGTASDFPVTVSNHLADAVSVAVVADTDNPQRIRFEPAEPLTIAPGASQTVLLRAVAVGSGVVNGQIHVEAPGALRLTDDVDVIVETTNFGTIGWVLVIASGVVLVVSTGLRIRQVRSRQGGGRLDG